MNIQKMQKTQVKCRKVRGEDSDPAELRVWSSLPSSAIRMEPEGLGSNLSSATYCCVIVDKFLYFSGPRLPYLCNAYNNISRPEGAAA